MKLEVLYEDEYMIAVTKPPGVPSQGDRSNDVDMVTRVRDYLFDKGDIDTEPYVAVLNRLDRPVGGIMLFAKSEDMAAKLTDMIQMKDETDEPSGSEAGDSKFSGSEAGDRESVDGHVTSENGDGHVTGENGDRHEIRGIRKYYQAILSGYLEEEEGTYTDWLFFDKKNNISKVVKEGTPGAKKAVLKYELIDEFETDKGYLTYVLIRLITGRHHQIRCQMAAHGTPIVGDVRYAAPGAARKASPREIALFSSRMEFVHPVTGERIVLRREPDTKAFEAIELDEF
ncbi:MAG: RluA family pseudouridine synthase [Eubacterium sp.]|nr:RluA family pseudouridine synthase [Eubacterium sp.]